MLYTAWTLKAVFCALILVIVKQVRDYLLGIVKRNQKDSKDQFKRYCKRKAGKP